MYGQPTQQATARAIQTAQVTRLGLISAAIFAVGAYFKNPLLGAAAGGAYFWMNRPEGGRNYVAPVGREGSCPPGMYNPGSGCIADHTYNPAMAKAMEGMSLGEKLNTLSSGHRY
tara:strand:- start:159 stop:503 length:345 start_codon:yes stop_codon:yes gene_type:complete